MGQSQHTPISPELPQTTRRIQGIRLKEQAAEILASFFLLCHLTIVSSIHSQTRIGHVHLKVADLDRAIAFYCDVLGFTVTQRMGNSAAFLAAGGYHHHIGLNTWESSGGKPPAQGTTGLYHLAILYPTRAELADALRRLLRAGISLERARPTMV